MRANVPLVIVCLGNKYREANIVRLDIAPGNVLRQSLTANPRFKTCCVNCTDNSNIVKPYIADTGEETLVLAQRTYREAMGVPAHSSAMDFDIMGTGLNRKCIIAVVDDEVTDVHVLSLDSEAVGVEWKAGSCADCVDDWICDLDVRPQ